MQGVDPVAICCKTESAFVRAHLWAITQRRTSILVTKADWRQLSVLRSALGDFDVLSDDPQNPDLRDFNPTQVSSLHDSNLSPSDSWPDPITVLLTSGTTGMPKPVVKRVATVLGEIQALSEGLKIDTATAFASTVPLEHMFGYMFAFWLPRLLGADVYPHRVIIPNNLKALCNAASKPLWIVTTPAHLRAYVELQLSFPNVAGVLCATSPLSCELARQAANCFGVPITEIYGTTETGAMAFRMRHASEEQEPWWSPLPGLAVSHGDDGLGQCRARYMEAVVLGDRIELDDAGFRILGRADDMVKVCGKRHSLAALNGLLSSMPGVRDAVYFFQGDGVGQELARPTAFVVLQSGASTQSVISHLRGHVDDVFLPRPVFEVDVLPRSDTGKLRKSDLEDIYRICQMRNQIDEQTRLASQSSRREN